MKRIVLACLLLSLASVAHAGPYGDDLSKCLVKSTTDQDKSLLVQWIFYAIALNPQLAPVANISPEQREQVDKGTARMFETLLTESCLKETQAAVKYEGSTAIAEAFKLLGQVASQEMFSDPAVSKGTENFSRYIDSDRIGKLLGLDKAQ